jgi:Fe-S cluster assembly iron-binding protein IscA
MLTLTTEAAAEIRNIVDQPDAPEGGGLRIANDPTAGSLTLSLAAVPGEDDRVVDESGARVFLDPQAAVMCSVLVGCCPPPPPPTIVNRPA